VRTWIYIADLAGDYAAFNPVRTAFFKRQGIRRIPASTGIQGGTLNPSVGCMLDLYALQADRPVRIEPMRSPTMNEAPSYGSSFSRGMTVASEEQTVVYVSGTASIDQQGQVFCEGDIEGQVNRMLQNVAALLHGQGASFDDVVTAITYLKRPDFLETFYGVWDVCGLPADIPNTVSIADVCRPEWLCEIEVIAVLPGGPVLS
jgi:enamine deaminase RidA (YjgF/YER057c/UK114 family)